MQRLLIALLGLLWPAVAFADATPGNLSTSATSPLPAGSCFYVDQGPGTDVKLCSGYFAALGATANVATWLGTPSGANFSSALTSGLPTSAIANAAITYGKMQNGAINGLLGVNNGSAPTEVSIGAGVQLVGGVLSATGSGATGFGVDTGASTQSVTGTATIANATRLVKVASGWATGTLTLPAISAVSADSCIRIEDGGGFVTGSATLTVAANAADALNNGALGGNTGAYTTSNMALAFCNVATHNWNIFVNTTIPTAAAGQMLQLGTSPNLAWSATPTLGASGTLGSLAFGNATSGTVTLNTVTGALGTVTASLPANTGRIAELNLNQTWTAGQAVTPDTATTCGTQAPAGTMTPDFSKSNSCQATFGAGNLTIAAPTNVITGQNYLIELQQDATGSRTATWNAAFDWGTAGAPTLSTGANKIDIISCYARTASGSNSLHCTANLGF